MCYTPENSWALVHILMSEISSGDDSLRQSDLAQAVEERLDASRLLHGDAVIEPHAGNRGVGGIGVAALPGGFLEWRVERWFFCIQMALLLVGPLFVADGLTCCRSHLRMVHPLARDVGS
jgi:hypothetical protein